MIKLRLHIIIPLLTVAILLCGCGEQDEVVIPEIYSTSVISFNANVALRTEVVEPSEPSTRLGASGPNNDVASLQSLNKGFGVFAYFTDTHVTQSSTDPIPTLSDGSTSHWDTGGWVPDASYDPYMMLNQQVVWGDSENDGISDSWIYSPLKYWPLRCRNGSKRFVNFFAYAPFAALDVVSPENITSTDRTGITGANANPQKTINSNRVSAPVIHYQLTSVPATPVTVEDQVDLLWGSAPLESSGSTVNWPLNINKFREHLGGGDIYDTSDGTETHTTIERIPFTFHHALSNVSVYVVRTFESAEEYAEYHAQDIEHQTKIYVSQFSLKPKSDGGVLQNGSLRLDNGKWIGCTASSSGFQISATGSALNDQIRGVPATDPLSTVELAQVQNWELNRYGTVEGVTETAVPLTQDGRGFLFIPQDTPAELEASITYSYVKRDNSLVLNDLKDANNNLYDRIVTSQKLDVRFEKLEANKRNIVLVIISPSIIRAKVVKVEDWDYPMRFHLNVDDMIEDEDDKKERTLNQ